MTPWSVMAQAVWPIPFTMPGRSRMRQAPSKRLNSVWTCKWTKDIGSLLSENSYFSSDRRIGGSNFAPQLGQ